MTAVTKNPQDARELKVRTTGEGDSLVQLTFGKKQRAGKQANERSKAIDRYVLARTPAFVHEAEYVKLEFNFYKCEYRRLEW